MRAKSATKTETARPQDLKFTAAELEKAFGKKMTHAQYLRSLRKNFDRHDHDDD